MYLSTKQIREIKQKFGPLCLPVNVSAHYTLWKIKTNYCNQFATIRI